MQYHVQRTMDEFDMFFLIKIDEHTKSYHKNFLFKTQNDYKRGKQLKQSVHYVMFV